MNELGHMNYLDMALRIVRSLDGMASPSMARCRGGTIRRFSFKRGCLRGRFCRHVFRFCFAEDDVRIRIRGLEAIRVRDDVQ